MPAKFSAPLTSETMRCPTCGAKQSWSETCRRCGCSLDLLQDIRASYLEQRAACLQAMQGGQWTQAHWYARQCWRIDPREDAGKLLIVCGLKLGLDSEAWSLAKRVAGSS